MGKKLFQKSSSTQAEVRSHCHHCHVPSLQLTNMDVSQNLTGTPRHSYGENTSPARLPSKHLRSDF